MDSIRITLETLYDILRNEKKREDLQNLEETFYIDVVTYLREKKAVIETTEDSDDIFAGGEKEKVEYELRSIKRILKEIYEKRQKKIIDIAINKSITKSDIIDTSAMLREEKEFYNEVLAILNTYRKGVLQQLFKAELPFLKAEEAQPSVFKKFQDSQPQQEESAPIKEPEEEQPPTEAEMIRIKFIHPMPSFVWKDMKEYGPFDEGEEIDIYPEVADLLVRKGRAEKV